MIQKFKVAGLLLSSIAALEFCPHGAGTPDGSSDGGIPSGVLDAAANVVDNACYLIEGVDTTGVSRTVCAVISEVIAIIGFLDTQRALQDAGPPARTQCQNLPQTTYCVTSAERAKAVQFVASLRAARQRLDAGN